MTMTMTMTQHTPTIGIFCRELTAGGDPFSNDDYWQAYQDLLLALKNRGVEAYFLTDNASYQGGGRFTTAYTTPAKTNLDQLQTVQDVQVDLVFDRGGFAGNDIMMINPRIITDLALSKIKMYEYFADLQPTSLVATNEQATAKAIEKLPGDKVVVKEPEGSGGDGVHIGKKEEILAELPDEYPVLVQEFMDTSGGVPGQVEGVHDVRLIFCGDEIIGYAVRQAKEGELLANTAQGGTMEHYDVKDIPPELAAMAKRVDQRFARQPRYYSVDFMHTPEGWKVVELNSYVGLSRADASPETQKVLETLADYLVAMASASRP